MRRMGVINYADVQTEGLEISGKTGTAEIPGDNGYTREINIFLNVKYAANHV